MLGWRYSVGSIRLHIVRIGVRKLGRLHIGLGAWRRFGVLGFLGEVLRPSLYLDDLWPQHRLGPGLGNLNGRDGPRI